MFIFRRISNFGQIEPPNMELSALKSLKTTPHRFRMGKTVSPLVVFDRSF